MIKPFKSNTFIWASTYVGYERRCTPIVYKPRNSIPEK